MEVSGTEAHRLGLGLWERCDRRQMQFHPAESICPDFYESKSNSVVENKSARPLLFLVGEGI